MLHIMVCGLTIESINSIGITNRFVVEPEGEPGDGDGHGAGHVDGDHEEGELAGEHEANL